jgi:hypothetical protein
VPVPVTSYIDVEKQIFISGLRELLKDRDYVIVQSLFVIIEINTVNLGL